MEQGPVDGEGERVKTIFALQTQFDGRAEIPLTEICDEWLDLSPREACRRAAAQTLPFPVHRLGSQKSPWMVSIFELAEYIERERREGREIAGASFSEKEQLLADIREAKRELAEMYPPVPGPEIPVERAGRGMPPRAGVYFVWRDGEVKYVGQSIRLSSRCGLSHHAMNPGEMLSWVEIEPVRLTWAECFYIGLLRPTRNFGQHAAHIKHAEAVA